MEIKKTHIISPCMPLLTRRRLLAGAAGIAAAGMIRPAGAVLRLEVTEGNVQPVPIALPDFLGGSPADSELARSISQVITADLRRSGLFAPIDPAAYIEKIVNADAVPRFADWKVINAQALVTGRLTRQTDGRLKSEFRLWDVFSGQQLIGQQYFTTPDNWRRVAHIISDAIYERLTGEKGYFDTRIVFIDETGPRERRVKRLAIMDQDGAAVRYLTRGEDLVLTPRFNPSTQEITYMSYGQGDPRVYLLNIETGQREIVGNFPGMTFAPRFSPDGRRVIMSSYFTPVWSPRGDAIAFTKRGQGTFGIGVIKPDGSGGRLLTDRFHNEGPTWAPNGRVNESAIFSLEFGNPRFGRRGTFVRRGGQASIILRPSSSASTERSCIACMYPQHTSAFFVNGIRICFPAPLFALSRVRQSSASSRALPIACALTGIAAMAVSQIRTKARVIFACQIGLRSTGINERIRLHLGAYL